MHVKARSNRQAKPFVADIRQPSEEPDVGGKGRRLYELTAMGASVPNGFTVTAAAFSDFLQATQLHDAIGDRLARVDVSDEAAIRAGSADIVAMIADASLPRHLAQLICDAYDALCFQSGTLRLKVAVRSSAIGEDAKDASFAGQFETYLGVAGHEALLNHVKKVWASLFNDRAILYRLKKGLRHDAPMAVVVLELADARSAGVAFSVDPLTGKRDRITIEGNWGFGESVVQGVVTPDRAAVDKADLRILDYVTADKTIVSVFDPQTRLVVEEPAPARFRKARVLGDHEVDTIARAVRDVEKQMGEPVDVEWVIPRHWRPGEPPVLVQVRPVTTLEAEAPAPAWNNLDYATKYGFGGGTVTASGDRFDYVIVGAGSAGAVLASRLSEDPRSTVCLIEAGPKDTHPFIAMPLGLIWLAKNTRHNWLYASAPQHGLGGRSVSIPRGRVLGGSSAINGMIYIRGQREDYDRWAEAGCTGWDYESVLPYFIKSENNRAPDLNGVHHGKSGPLSVTDLADPNPMDTVFIEAAGQLQFRPNRDFNGAGQEGVGIYQVTQEGGRRHSTAHAFLEPARGRANLRVVTSSQVAALEWSNDRVAGVRVRDGDGNERAIGADREVILSAGAIGSPEILMRSGIGPGADLTAAGIAVKHDLPGVGANLHDHVDCLVICKSRSRTPYGLSAGAAPKLFYEGLRYLAARRGMLASNMVEAGGFVRSQPDVERPDIQFHFIPGRKSHRGRMLEYGHGVSLHTGVLRPKSRGAVTLNEADPSARPVIDLGLLREEDDMQLLMRGVKIARDILRQQPFAPHGLSEILPGDGVTNDAELTAFIREHARSVYHPVGTCAMGTGPRAVVDPRLKVRGVEGLRIVDASIMPEIVSGNTNAPTIMIAEKAADMIRQDAATRH